MSAVDKEKLTESDLFGDEPPEDGTEAEAVSQDQGPEEEVLDPDAPEPDEEPNHEPDPEFEAMNEGAVPEATVKSKKKAAGNGHARPGKPGAPKPQATRAKIGKSARATKVKMSDASKAAAKAKAKAKAEAKAQHQAEWKDKTKKDEFGFRIGSLRSKAAALYKKGATLEEVTSKLGSVQYNILAKMEERGHKVTVTKVTHKDWKRPRFKYKVEARAQ